MANPQPGDIKVVTSGDEIKVVCPHCSETFSSFLQQMADHNLTVTCPRCGKSHSHQHSESI